MEDIKICDSQRKPNKCLSKVIPKKILSEKIQNKLLKQLEKEYNEANLKSSNLNIPKENIRYKEKKNFSIENKIIYREICVGNLVRKNQEEKEFLNENSLNSRFSDISSNSIKMKKKKTSHDLHRKIPSNLIIYDYSKKNKSKINTDLGIINCYGKDLIKNISLALNKENDLFSFHNENNQFVEKSKSSKNINSSIINSGNHSKNNLKIDLFKSNSKENHEIIENIYKKTKINNSNNILKNNSIERNPIDDNMSNNLTFKLGKYEYQEASFYIDSTSNFKRIWDILVICLVLYTILITPLFICFWNLSLSYKLCEPFIELIFILDFFFNFFTSIDDIEDNKITDNKEIVENYIFSWLFFDIFSLYPNILLNNFHILDTIHSKSFLLIEWLKIIRITKLIRNNIFKKHFLQDVLNHNIKLSRVFEYAFYFLILGHIFGCFFIFVGKKCENNENWINRFNFNTYEDFDLYITSIYYIFVTVCTIGYGDITPVNINEIICVTFIMFVSNLLYSYAISSLSSMFIQDNKNYIEFKNKYNVLKSIDKEYELNHNLYSKIKKTLKSEYKHKKNEIYQLLDDLPSNLKNDLLVTIYHSFVENHKFFKNQPIDFILQVLPLLKPVNLKRGDILFSVGDIIDEMYFVEKGTLSLNIGKELYNLEIQEINKHSHFGDIFLQSNQSSPYELICKSKTAKILILKKEDYLKLKIKYSDNIFNIIEESLSEFKSLDHKRKIYSRIIQEDNDPKNNKKRINKKLISLFEEELCEIFGITNENEKVPKNKHNLSNNKINKITSKTETFKDEVNKNTLRRSEDIISLVKKKNNNEKESVICSEVFNIPNLNLIVENVRLNEKNDDYNSKSGDNLEDLHENMFSNEKEKKKIKRNYDKMNVLLKNELKKSQTQGIFKREQILNNKLNDYFQNSNNGVYLKQNKKTDLNFYKFHSKKETFLRLNKSSRIPDQYLDIQRSENINILNNKLYYHKIDLPDEEKYLLKFNKINTIGNKFLKSKMSDKTNKIWSESKNFLLKFKGKSKSRNYSLIKVTNSPKTIKQNYTEDLMIIKLNSILKQIKDYGKSEKLIDDK